MIKEIKRNRQKERSKSKEKEKLNENSKKMEETKKEKEIDDYSKEKYREYCKGIMSDYGFHDYNEMKSYINELLRKNGNNKKRVEKIKKLLMTGKTHYIKAINRT